jgi:hypothetical protein
MGCGSKVLDDVLGIDDTKVFGIKTKNLIGGLDKILPDSVSPLARAKKEARKEQAKIDASNASMSDGKSPEETTEPSQTVGMDDSLLQKDRSKMRKYLSRRQRYNTARTMLASRRRRRSSDDDMTLGA